MNTSIINKFGHSLPILAISLSATLLLGACSQDIATHSAEMPTDGRILFSVGSTPTLSMTRAAVNTSLTPIALKGAKGDLWLIPSVESTSTDQQTTRGTQLGSNNKMSAFGVSAFKHEATDDNLNDNKPDYFYNLEATEVGETGIYQISKPYYWPTGTEALTFNAYYPYSSNLVTLSDLTEETKNNGQQSFAVTVAANAKEQVDFMTATTGATPDESFKTSAGPRVALNFQHHMAAVRFVLGDQFLSGYIKSIAISGVYGKGTYIIGQGWTTSDDDKTDVNISYVSQDRIDKHVDGSSDETITSTEETFLLIPQQFTGNDAAKITILYNDGYDDYTVEASLAGQDEWAEGTTVTYAISSKYLTTLRISELTYPVTVDGAPKTAWEIGDKVGMYVVKPDGTTIEYENIPVEYVGGTSNWKWQINHPEGKTIYKLPGYSYYFYYPYVEGAPTGYTISGHAASEEATAFFSGVISAYTTVADQSTASKFNNADLQVARAEDDVRASTVKATMIRQVGLARLQLNAPAAIPNINYYLNNELNQTKTTASGTASRTATNSFDGNTPCGSGGTYYFYTKANTATTINSVQTDVNTWKNGLTYTLAAGSTSDVQTAYSRRSDWNSINAVWDFSCQKKVAEFTGYQETSIESYTYKLQVWGASGGGDTRQEMGSHRGLGGYSYGNYTKAPSTKLYVFVGGEGKPLGLASQPASDIQGGGGYNGGGNAFHYANCGPFDCYGGGGMTHISTTNNPAPSSSSNPAEWSSTGTLLVAGGGGGSDNADNTGLWTRDDGSGGYGGGETAERGHTNTSFFVWPAANQTSGYKQGIGQSAALSFSASSNGNKNEIGGGGGGWWGGYGGDCGNSGGGGGSGYVGGVATPKATINGATSFEAPNGGTETGHGGDGYARITLNRE